MLFLLNVGYFILFSLIFSTDSFAQPDPMVPPSADPFYTPPTGFENEKPGTVLKSRELGKNALAAFGLFPQNIKNVYQYLYRTNDGLGKPVVTVTTLAIPYNADYSKLVSHQIAEDSATIDCAPSYALRSNTSVSDYLVQVEILLLDTSLARGWPVCFADYEGPDALFTVGKMAGHGVLDGLRAVLSAGESTGIQKNAQIQMWGYSGGALATGWASQLHATYAPELNIVGAAFGGTPIDLGKSVVSLKGQPFSSFATMALHGLMNQYDAVANYVESHLHPERKNEFYRLKNICITPVIRKFGLEGLDYFIDDTNILEAPAIKQAVSENILGGAPPKFPLFMYHSMKDVVIPYQSSVKLYKDWCSQGARIEYVLDRYETHARLEYLGTANAFLFMERIFKGESAPEKCSMRTTISSALSPAAIRVFGEAIWHAMGAIFGYPLGPKKSPRY